MVDRISAASAIVYDLRLDGRGKDAPSAYDTCLRGDTMGGVDLDFAVVARDANDRRGRYIVDDDNSILVSGGGNRGILDVVCLCVICYYY